MCLHYSPIFALNHDNSRTGLHLNVRQRSELYDIIWRVKGGFDACISAGLRARVLDRSEASGRALISADLPHEPHVNFDKQWSDSVEQSFAT